MSRPGLIDIGDVAIGVVARAGESAAEQYKVVRARAAREGSAAGGWRRQLTTLAERGAAERAALAERGAVERARARTRAARALDAAMTAVATSTLVNRIVEVQVDRVLALLEGEPDRIRVLIRGQRDTMVGEVVGRVRTGAAAGDAAVDRFTLRMSRRGGAAEPS